MSAGTATALVRDGAKEGHDPPTTDSSPPKPEKKPHWIDVDRLPSPGNSRPPPWPIRRLPPSYPSPPAPSRRRVAIGIGVSCCSLFVALAVSFGHVKPLYTPSLPKGEVVGQVVGVTGDTYIVQYSGSGRTDSSDISAATGSVKDGQSVTVRADNGTVVSTSVPGLRLGVGFLGAMAGIVLIVSLLVSLWLRVWTIRDRVRASEEATDYRDDIWSGTSYSR